MKFLIGFLFCVTALFADTQKLIIDALNFETNDSKGLSIFTGNVKLQMGKDRLNSNKLEVYIKTKSKKPLKYVASGNVTFDIFSNGKHFKGKGNKIVFNPLKDEYRISGNGYLKEISQNRELFGEKIFINKRTGNAKVTGSSSKPVRFILDIDTGK
jgi:lipopolysaccharide export system protein LptA